MKVVRVEHAGQVREVDLETSDTPVQPGDRVFVPQKEVLTYVLVDGLVGSPSRIPFKEGMMLSEAVEAAGGAKEKADLGHVQITRQVDGKDKVMTHDLAAVYASKAGDFPLRANDRVTVPVHVAKKPGRRSNDALKIVGALVIGAIFGIFRF
jgi:protein involved in polysaccharide export with SLBB domain